MAPKPPLRSQIEFGRTHPHNSREVNCRMTLVEILALLISTGVILEIVRAVIRAFRVYLLKRGHYLSELDSLRKARQQWIERTYEVRRAYMKGEEIPDLDNLDAYDEWRQGKNLLKKEE